MDSQLIQRTRYQLQARVRRARGCPLRLFPSACAELLTWISTNAFLNALSRPLEEHAASFHARFATEFQAVERMEDLQGPWETQTPTASAGFYLAAVRAVSKLDYRSRQQQYQTNFLAAVVAGHEDYTQKLEGAVEAMRDVAVQGLYEWLDEAIDSRNAVLGLLVKYKTRCEMYRRGRLREAAAVGVEGRTRERALAFDLYEYLHDQGVDFSIESVTSSGEPDLLSSGGAGEALVADAKYVDANSDPRRTLIAGFRQVFEYCRDKNEATGYLVVFVDRDITLDLRGERDDGFPCFRTGGYTIYYVVIDIFGHPTTASKRPKPNVLVLSIKDLIAELTPENATPAPLSVEVGGESKSQS